MSKSKKGPALVELMRSRASDRETATPEVPDWWHRSPVVTKPAAPTRPEPIEEPAARAPAERPTPPPSTFAEVQRNRVVLSFTSVGAGITVFIIIALITGGFVAGREIGIKAGTRQGYQAGLDSVRAKTADEIERARRSKPNPDIFKNLKSSPVTDTAKTPTTRRTNDPGTSRRTAQDQTPPPKSRPKRSTRQSSPPPTTTASTDIQWIQGYTYIIVQEFRSEDQADALEARQFLQGHGVSTTMLESKGRYKYRLVVNKGFNCDDANQRKWCDKMHERVQELGKLYVKAGGRYDLQGYQKKLTGSGW